MQTIPNSVKVTKVCQWGNKAVRKSRLYIQKFSLWATSVIRVPQKPDPLHPHKQQLCLLLDYRSFNKSINAAHRGNSIISYYHLPNIMYLLTRLQNFTIFSSLDIRSCYHHISLAPKAKLKLLLPQQVVKGAGMWLLLAYAHSQVFSVTLCHRFFVGFTFLLCIHQWHTDLQLTMEVASATSWGV